MPQSINDYCNTIDTDTVYWCMGDIGVLSLTLNWLQSCKLLGIPILFVALDTEMYEAIKDINPRSPCVRIQIYYRTTDNERWQELVLY